MTPAAEPGMGMGPAMGSEMLGPGMGEPEMGLDPVPGLPPADPAAEPQLEPEAGLEQPPPPSPPPPDPVSLALDVVLDLSGQEAIRRVYQLATSAARTKAKVAASLDRLDARAYHDLLSKTPEARFAQELIAARRRLDTLAQERRNLNLELTAGSAAEPRRRMLEVQVAACTMAMEQVAAGTLIYLALPMDVAFLSSSPTSEPVPEPTPEPTPIPEGESA